MKLYKLASEYQQFADLIEDYNDEELSNALVSLKGELVEKCVSVAEVCKQIEALENVYKAEEQRLAGQRKMLENKRERIKAYLLYQMQHAQIDKAEVGTTKVYIKTNPPSVQVLDESIIPASYIRVIPESYAVDKKSIIDSWKQTGEAIPGVEVVADKRSLTIK